MEYLETAEEKRRMFIESCKLYEWELMEYTTLKEAKSISTIEEQTLIYLEEDLHQIDAMFQTIKETCGTSAVTILWSLYIEGKTKKELSTHFKIPIRSLRNMIDIWEYNIFQ